MVAAPLATMRAARGTARLGLLAIGYVLGEAATRAVDYRVNSATAPHRPVLSPAARSTDEPPLTGGSGRPAGTAAAVIVGSPEMAPVAVELLAIEDYDQLTGRQIVAALDDLTVEDLEAIRAFEQMERRRQTVLSAIDRALLSVGD